MEIVNTAIEKFCHDNVTVRNYPEIVAMALQAEVDRLTVGAAAS